MNLIIDNYGVKIEVEEEQFAISLNEERRLVSPLKLKSINVLKPASMTTPALILAAQHQIPVLIYNNIGEVEAWVGAATYNNIADIRKAQVYFCDSSEGLAWVKHLLKEKNNGKLQCLKYLKHAIKAYNTEIEEAILQIEKLDKLLLSAQNLASLSGYEGKMATYYWAVLAKAFHKICLIPSRVQDNPDDIFNASINYLYGMLYGMVEASLLMVGLDPYMGIMHTNRYQQPALAFDHIEPFRYWADRLVIDLLLSRQLTSADITLNEAGFYRINSAAKRILIDAFFHKMEERSYLNGKRIKNKDHIHFLSEQLVQILKKFPKK